MGSIVEIVEFNIMSLPEVSVGRMIPAIIEDFETGHSIKLDGDCRWGWVGFVQGYRYDIGLDSKRLSHWDDIIYNETTKSVLPNNESVETFSWYRGYGNPSYWDSDDPKLISYAKVLALKESMRTGKRISSSSLTLDSEENDMQANAFTPLPPRRQRATLSPDPELSDSEREMAQYWLSYR